MDIQIEALEGIKISTQTKDKNSLLDTWLDKASVGAVCFYYQKVDGTLRYATGTINKNLLSLLLGKDYVDKESDKASEYVNYFDFSAMGFRRFKKDAILAVV